MRPRKLELHGFTAFRDPQVVDFSHLDLFVITGPTGAGKTSLLDAMAFALYGQVPRMGKHGLGQLVSHGKAEARVLLEFDVDGHTYRVARRLPRQGAQKGQLERADGDNWVDAVERSGVRPVNEAIEELVKLDFESFCKAILLPQGEFARFLKGDPGERRTTLVALLGLSAYERMGTRARERSRELGIRSKQTRTIVDEQFADATSEALDKAQERLDRASVAATSAAENLAAAHAFEKRRAETATRAETAQALAERFAGLSEELTRERESCEAAEKAKAESESERAQALTASNAADATALDSEAQLAAVLKRTGTREDLARLIEAANQRTLLDERVARAGTSLAEAVASVALRTDEVERRTGAEDEAKEALTSAQTDESSGRGESERLAGERQQIDRQLQDAATAADAHVNACAVVEDRKGEADHATAASTEARRALETAQRELAALERGHLVAVLVEGLDAGDPCPVCDRPLADYPASDPDVEQALTRSREHCGSAASAAARAQEHAAKAEASVTAATVAVANAEAAIAAALGDHESKLKLEQKAAATATAAEDGVASLAAAIALREQAAAIAQDIVVALTKAQTELEAARSRHGLYEVALEQATSDRETAVSLLRERFGEEVPADASARLDADRGELIAAEDRAEAAREAAAIARAALSEVDEAHLNAISMLTAIDLRLSQLQTRAEGAVAEVNRDPDPPTLPDMSDPAELRDQRASELADWCTVSGQALGAAAAERAAAAEIAATELVNLAVATGLAADNATTAMEILVVAERDAMTARVRAEAALTQLDQRVKQRSELEKSIAADIEAIAILDVLAAELRGDRFIEFIVQETLDVLAGHASEELLRISDRRYSLVSRGGDFSVVDHVNADEERSVKTLSGGETFMASLSLALALSKHVSELAGEGLGARLEAVFIDEGFGSLDAETLEEVIDALERLRENNLMIGVISHVPALAERIGAGLQVRKDGNRSVIIDAR